MSLFFQKHKFIRNNWTGTDKPTTKSNSKFKEKPTIAEAPVVLINSKDVTRYPDPVLLLANWERKSRFPEKYWSTSEGEGRILGGWKNRTTEILRKKKPWEGRDLYWRSLTKWKTSSERGAIEKKQEAVSQEEDRKRQVKTDKWVRLIVRKIRIFISPAVYCFNCFQLSSHFSRHDQ